MHMGFPQKIFMKMHWKVSKNDQECESPDPPVVLSGKWQRWGYKKYTYYSSSSICLPT